VDGSCRVRAGRWWDALWRRSAIGDDGTSPETSDLNGYSILEADSLDAARLLVDGHPFLSEGKGRFSIEIFELVPMPM
jgi:hypothetical protein